MNRRGLSNIAAALVLILTVLAVASGVYIYTETLSSGGRASGLQILSASITYSGGRAYLEVDVQNTGSVKLTNVVVHMNPAGSTYSTVYTSTSTSGTPGPVRTTNAWYGYVNGPTGSVTQAVNVPQGSNAEAVMMCVSNILWSSPLHARSPRRAAARQSSASSPRRMRSTWRYSYANQASTPSQPRRPRKTMRGWTSRES
ncbi:hypothetical protein B9Q03_11030 [Candidatus Marsarchaeota G2 archaeon OSP_D]|uniref:Uncharacterized protein n=1 Tax=Candidatus Marsarchaeota G2 archaeon OSP_D TaxID=1978157 RepID=A0A2R6ALG3_9ARCH|nr:MAG: hypothetical protein B9Q03_11030 [Candidatus Marsarchaeota G2 archaeon OSP_D]